MLTKLKLTKIEGDEIPVVVNRMLTKLKLTEGDAIGIFSPSTPITSNCPNRSKRAMELNILIRDPNVKCIMSTIERSFSLLKLSGVFDKVSGIILGKHELFNDNNMGRKPYEILLEVIGENTIPFLADFDCCHTHPMLTLPIGCKIKLDATNKRIFILEE